MLEIKKAVIWQRTQILLLICVLAIFMLTNCTDDKQDGKPILYKGPLEIANNIEVLHSEGAILKIRLHTAKQIRLQNEDKIFPEKVFVDFFGLQKEVITTMVSDSGRFDFARNVYIVKGNVTVMKNQTQEKLLTDELVWNPTTKKVYSDKVCTLERISFGEKMQGTGMTAEQDFSNLTLRKPKGIFNRPVGVE